MYWLAHCLLPSYVCIVNVIDSSFTGTKATNFSEAMKSGPTSPVVALVAFFSIWSVAGLAGFHSYLTALNMTTNEDVSSQAMLMLFGSLKYLFCTCKVLAFNRTLKFYKKIQSCLHYLFPSHVRSE